MEAITSASFSVYFKEEAYQQLNTHLANANYSKVFILVDENTHNHCLPSFMSEIYGDYDFEIIEIEAGEINKNIHTCTQVWEVLSELDADRKSVVLNLGGGVVTDLGGFVASTFKRGIDFINIPTSLLAMVDASVGGKTGVDLGSLKNQVGVINQPIMVLILPNFLSSLSEREWRSGYAEMLKHGLISDSNYWEELKTMPELDKLISYIHTSVQIKNKVVLQDPTEQNLRKILNFGHTLGHAIESYYLQHNTASSLTHGEAIAIGMVLEGYLSHHICDLPLSAVEDIKTTMDTYYKKVNITPTAIDAILELLKFDKKNSHGTVKFVLLSEIGVAEIDKEVAPELFKEAFSYYSK